MVGCRLMTSSELPVLSYEVIQFIAAFVGPGCAWEGPSYTPRLVSMSTEHGGESAEGPRHLPVRLSP